MCSKCGYELFSSQAKFEHSSPWPAFTKTVHADSVSKYEERPGTLKVGTKSCWLGSEGPRVPSAAQTLAGKGGRTGTSLHSPLSSLPGIVRQVRQWPGPRVPQRRAEEGAVPLLNIQQLAEVHPQR